MANKNEEYGDDFRFLVRIASTDLDGKKSVAQGLTGLKGVNNRLSRIIDDHGGVGVSVLEWRKSETDAWQAYAAPIVRTWFARFANQRS